MGSAQTLVFHPAAGGRRPAARRAVHTAALPTLQ